LGASDAAVPELVALCRLAMVVPERLLVLPLEPPPPHAAGSPVAASARMISRTERRIGASRGLGAVGRDGRARTPGS